MKPVTKITHVVHAIGVGGIEAMVISMLDQAASNEQVSIISLTDTHEHALQQWPCLHQHADKIICLNRKVWDLRGLWQVYRVLKTYDPDVVYTHHVGPLIYGGIAAKLLAVKKHIHLAHDTYHLKSIKLRIIERYLLSYLKPRVIAVSNSVAKGFKQALNCSSRVINNGIDTERFITGDKLAARARFKLPVKPILLGWVGRINPIKGLEYLVQAMPLLPEHISLVLAGDGESEVNIFRGILM